MNWWSETAVLWLPVAQQPYPTEFGDRAGRGSSDFYYYALDAFDAISRRAGHASSSANPGPMSWIASKFCRLRKSTS
jgi:hypothetical protein